MRTAQCQMPLVLGTILKPFVIVAGRWWGSWSGSALAEVLRPCRSLGTGREDYFVENGQRLGEMTACRTK